VLFLLGFFPAAAFSQSPAHPIALFRQPTLSTSHVVFHYAGDLWIVSREGGQAQRLTTGTGQETNPCFSPDGRWVAFSGEYDGNTDVFLIPATGGVPRRLTWHPGADMAQGWTPDSRKVLFRSPRNSYSRFGRLFTISIDGSYPEEVPLHMAEEASFSPDGAMIACVPLARPFGTWKRYRGGRATPIWIARLSDSSIEKLPRENWNDFNPMWIGDRIYFLSDRNGPATLFCFDTKSRKTTQVLTNGGFEIKNAAAGAGAIVYEQFGGLGLFDLKSQKSKRLDIRVDGDMPEVRPRVEKLSGRITTAMISPSGARALFEARGEILTVPAEKGDCRNLTNSPGVAERDPAWSPDGKWIAYLSDASGEYDLHIREHTGKGEAKVFRLGNPPSFYYTPTWSPDNKKIAFTDKKLNVSYLDINSGAIAQVDRDRFDGPRRIRHLAWSPDSNWLAYTKQLENTLRAVFIYSVEGKTTRQVTDGLSDARLPVFDKDGKHLYFLASTNTGLTLGWRDMSSFLRPVTSSVYVVVLRKDLPSPLAPESDEEKPADSEEKGAQKSEDKGQTAESRPADSGGTKEEKPSGSDKTVTVKIDFDGIGDRTLPLPIPARDYSGLAAGKSGVLFLMESLFAGSPSGQSGQVLHKFELKTRKTEKLLDGVGVFEVSANGEKMLYRQGERWFISLVSQAPKAGEGALKLDGMEARVEPETEWRQMYREVWRIQRDFFYDPNLHGLDLPGMMKKYEPFLSQVASRGDLNYLFSEMMGEFTASHLYVGGGEQPEVRRVPSGLLGTDYSIENGRYRFKRVYSGESWNPDLRAPLAQPGVNVAAGEYLLRVNGRELRASDNIYSYFEAMAGRQALLTVGPNPDDNASREVTVIPVDSETTLRNVAWIEDNRRKVDELSGGRLAYVYLPDTSWGGYTSFNRYYFAQVGKLGAIMDERFNAGGAQPDYIIDYLRRPLLFFRTMREGEDIQGPLAGIFGPKVMLINEYAGSGGDSMPWYFRRAGVGPLIGKRTWGGLVGGLGGWPALIDGGTVSPPSVGFWDAQTGQWVAENVGIAPDTEVEQDPQAVRQGRDPQLEKAVEYLLEQLRKNPPPRYKRPPFPNYHPTKPEERKR
jgi:tricorn protease